MLFCQYEICKIGFLGNNSEINSDYYYGNMVVRSGRVIIECDNKFNKEYCHLKCGNSGYECVNDKCVCAKANKRLSSLLEMRGKTIITFCTAAAYQITIYRDIEGESSK